MARLLPKLLHSLGAIARPGYVEANREDLVASYVGGTAKLTKERIAMARGGAMFIDEAYRLSEARSERDFGLEAIETIRTLTLTLSVGLEAIETIRTSTLTLTLNLALRRSRRSWSR